MLVLPPVAILAGGLATRLRPITEKIPKSLVSVNGRPFIAHQLELLRRRGVRKVVMCVGFLGDQIVDYVGNGDRFEIEVQYSFEGTQLLGTGGAIKRALPLLAPQFFVLYGDSYLQCDYQAVFNSFCDSGRMALMTVFRNENLWDTSNVEFSNGRVLAYSKRQRTTNMCYIDFGLGVFSHEVFENVPVNTAVDLAIIYEDLLTKNQLAGYEVGERFYEMGSRYGLEELSTFLAQQGNAGD